VSGRGNGDAARRLAQAASGILEPTFENVEQVAATVISTRPRGGARWSEAHMAPVQSQVLDLISHDPLVAGMGFVAAPGIVDGRERYMLWWQRNEGRTSRLKLNFDRSSIDVYDYVEMEWFQQSAAGQPRVMVGPFVDYSGSELYIVTATVPVMSGDDFIGVAGADLLFGEVERGLVGVLRRASAEAVIVTAERRVVATNSARWVPGSLLPAVPEEGLSIGEVTFDAVERLPLGSGWVLAMARGTSFP
jgi:hypothetical protein